MSGFPEGPTERKEPAPPDPLDVNPYAAPRSVPQRTDGTSQSGPGMVGHVPVLAILMIVQGGLEAVAGLLLLVAAVMAPMLLRNAEGPPPPENMFWVIGIVYGVMAAAAIIAAVLHILGGVWAYRFRKRTVGIVALAVGIASTFTCYCAPTSIALAIYGLIVLLNPRVAQAFAMGDDGISREDVLAAFRA